MGILVQIFMHYLKNKIPEYAMNFKNEYLFIIGINKKCERFLDKLYEEEENVFKSGCQRKPGKMLKMSTEGGRQNQFILTS